MPAKNEALLDAVVRHQLVLERLKAAQVRELEKLLRSFHAKANDLIRGLPADKLSENKKRDLSLLQTKLKREMIALFEKHEAQLTKWLQDFAAIFWTINVASLEEASGESYTGEALLAASALLLLWRRFRRTPIAASGETPLDMLRRAHAGLLASVGNTIRRGQVEGWTITQLLAALFGTRVAGAGASVLGRAFNGMRAAIVTIIQAFNSFLRSVLTGQMFEYYRWVSVMDERTTPICRSRNNNIYRRGEGPLPPAHFNCRSDIAPVTLGSRVVPQPAFYLWLHRQPDSVLAAILGRDQLRRLRANPRAFRRVVDLVFRPLSLSSYRSVTRYLTATE